MSKLRRCHTDGRPVFVTAVTHNRKPILRQHGAMLLDVIRFYERKYEFVTLAWAILPDHFHLILQSDSGTISGIMRRIKSSFTIAHRKSHEGSSSDEKIWQNRFWDHVIRDSSDLNRHIDYVHYNPVKHGLVSTPFDYHLTSLDLFAKRGYYAPDWGKVATLEGEFGE